MSRYQAEHRSRDEFMQDLFELLNPLINKQGSFGLIMGLPLPTEAIINDIRPDISQRLQYCNLFIRPNTMYSRDFPKVLWEKFSEVFEFQEISSEILPNDTLDSIGQIAFRDDLGAGPRTVIEAFRRAIDHYDQTQMIFSPIDLINAYIGHFIAFDSGGKLIGAVAEVLQSRDVQNINGVENVVKLMAAYPMGCPDERFKTYGLQEAKDEITRRIYTEYLYKFPEGISLRKLAPTERGSEPRFIELTKDFIQTYSESERDLTSAIQAFQEVIILDELLVPRRKDQIEGWIRDSRVKYQYIGTFDHKYPERKLRIQVAQNRDELSGNYEEFAIDFLFDKVCEEESSGRIEKNDPSGTHAIFCLNLLRQSSKLLNIPYIEELGYPARKVTPAFMLALVNHLRKNEQLIPEDEKRIQLPPFIRSLISYSIQLLFGEDLLENAGISGLSKVGLSLPQEVFSLMCRSTYPNYETLITSSRWEGAYTAYLSALNSTTVSSSVGILRGNKPLKIPQKDVLALFGETKVQTFKGLSESLSSVLDVDLGPKADSDSSVRLKLHPSEETFMEALRNSDEKISKGSIEIRVLEQHQGFRILRDLGYREEEIGIILKLLKSRRLIDFDSKRQIFVEVIESPIERREAIITSLMETRKKVIILSKIPDFDKENISLQLDKLEEEVSDCDDIERLEEYQNKLTSLRDGLNRFSKNWESTIQSNFDRVRQEVGSVIRTPLPADVTRQLKGDVNWVGEIVQCQALIKDKYQRCSTAFRNVESSITSAWNKWINSSPSDPNALVSLYDANLAAQSELKDAQADFDAANAYLRSFGSWLGVLNIASRAHREATGCALSYQQAQFQRELNLIFQEIIDRFQKKRLEALPDHEIYEERIREIQSQIDSWLRGRRENFMEAKQTYENTLKSIGLERYNLRATFDPFDPDTSLTNLYSEVYEKTQLYIQVLEQELERYRTETMYAEQVVGEDVSTPQKLIVEAIEELNNIKKEVTDSNIRQQDQYGIIGSAISSLSINIQEAEQSLRGILRKREPTPEENIILATLEDPRGTDLSVVIASQLINESVKFSLDELMTRIISLFKKNQIIIKLEKRR